MSFIFNQEWRSQEELGSSALFPVVYNGRQLALAREAARHKPTRSSKLPRGPASTGQKSL